MGPHACPPLVRLAQDHAPLRTMRFHQKHKNSVKACVQIYENWRRRAA